MKQLPVIFLFMLVFAATGQTTYTDPEPYGGKAGLKELLETELVYPEESYQNKDEGTTVVEFIVYAGGRTSKAFVYESSGFDALDNEALRLAALLSWLPGTQNGHRVDMQERITVKFNVYKYDKICRKRGYKHHEYLVSRISTDPTIHTEEDLDTLAQPILRSDKMTLGDHMSLTVQYPEEAQRYNIEGTATISFVIEPHGGLTNIHVEQNLGGGCPQEMIRAVRALDWIPAIKNGRAVRSRQIISMGFRLGGISDFEFQPANQTGVMF
jgi:protein TonB